MEAVSQCILDFSCPQDASLVTQCSAPCTGFLLDRQFALCKVGPKGHRALVLQTCPRLTLLEQALARCPRTGALSLRVSAADGSMDSQVTVPVDFDFEGSEPVEVKWPGCGLVVNTCDARLGGVRGVERKHPQSGEQHMLHARQSPLVVEQL